MSKPSAIAVEIASINAEIAVLMQIRERLTRLHTDSGTETDEPKAKRGRKRRIGLAPEMPASAARPLVEKL